MVDSIVDQFTTKMEDLLFIEREAELEESSALMSSFSFKVSQTLSS